MKNFSLVVVTLFAAMVSTGQEPVRFKEIGLNATPLVHQFLNFSGTAPQISPYVITYEQRLGVVGFRAGIGLTASSDVQLPDFDNNIPEIETNNTQLATRIGAVFYKDLSEKWGLKYGLDLTYALGADVTKSYTYDFFGTEVVNTVSDKTAEAGISPFVFVQYRFNPHFSIGTELLGHATRSTRVTSEESTQFPEFDTKFERTTARYGLSAPTALFFIFRF